VRPRNAKHRAARDLIESGPAAFLAKTVALELEWVLRGYYGLPRWRRCCRVFDHLLAHPASRQEDQASPGAGRGRCGQWARLRRCPAPSSLRRLRGDGVVDDRGFVRAVASSILGANVCFDRHVLSREFRACMSQTNSETGRLAPGAP